MEEKKEKNQMDIFTKGFVKPAYETEKIEIEDVNNTDLKSELSNKNIDSEVKNIDNKNIINDAKNISDNEKNLDNNIKYNNIKMKEKTDKLIKELEEQDTERDKKNKKKKSKKNILLIIGIIIEILVILFLIYIKFFKETYKTVLTCTNTSENTSNNYTITTNNVYYFDKENNVAKTDNSIIYIFNDKKAYEEYKTTYTDTNIKNFSGIMQKDVFDDQNYAHENKTTYTYSKLKKNKNVKIKDKLMTISVPNRKDAITIYIESYDNVIKTNEEMGFTCE